MRARWCIVVGVVDVVGRQRRPTVSPFFLAFRCCCRNVVCHFFPSCYDLEETSTSECTYWYWFMALRAQVQDERARESQENSPFFFSKKKRWLLRQEQRVLLFFSPSVASARLLSCASVALSAEKRAASDGARHRFECAMENRLTRWKEKKRAIQSVDEKRKK